jgi:hypothetical protein
MEKKYREQCVCQECGCDRFIKRLPSHQPSYYCDTYFICERCGWTICNILNDSKVMSKWMTSGATGWKPISESEHSSYYDRYNDTCVFVRTI